MYQSATCRVEPQADGTAVLSATDWSRPARGIGEAIARAFIQEGADVYLTDIETAAGEAVAHSLGKRAMFRRLDVREEHDWARVTAEGG